jgi:hypothetical protein
MRGPIADGCGSRVADACRVFVAWAPKYRRAERLLRRRSSGVESLPYRQRGASLSMCLDDYVLLSL